MPSLDVLDLAPGFVESTALIHTGYAVALRAETSNESSQRKSRTPAQLQDMAFVAASSFVKAASFYSISCPYIAKAIFGAAARLYQELDMPYGGLLAICANDEALLERSWSREVEAQRPLLKWNNIVPRLLLALRMASESSMTRGLLSRFLEESASVGGALVGNSLLPTRVYHDFTREILAIVEGDGQPLEVRPSATMFLLESSATRTETAMVDRFHWRRLATTLLPVEPEILAAAITAREAFRSKEHDVLSLLREAEMPPVAIVPMEVAEALLQVRSPSRHEERIIASSLALQSLLGQRGEPSPGTGQSNPQIGRFR